MGRLDHVEREAGARGQGDARGQERVGQRDDARRREVERPADVGQRADEHGNRNVAAQELDDAHAQRLVTREGEEVGVEHDRPGELAPRERLLQAGQDLASGRGDRVDLAGVQRSRRDRGGPPFSLGAGQARLADVHADPCRMGVPALRREVGRETLPAAPRVALQVEHEWARRGRHEAVERGQPEERLCRLDRGGVGVGFHLFATRIHHQKTKDQTKLL